MALYLQSPTFLGGMPMDCERGNKREQVTGGQGNLQIVELKTFLPIVVMSINNEAWWARLAECEDWRAELCGG
jgi:hypothetical protein